MHNNKQNKFECTICNRFQCQNRNELILHISTYHKLNNSLKNDLSINTHASSIKCAKCSKSFQDDNEFFIHIFNNHFNDVLRTVKNSRMKANVNKIQELFEPLQITKTQPPASEVNENGYTPDINYILSIESWGQALISNRINSMVQTDESALKTANQPFDFKTIEQQNISTSKFPNTMKNENKCDQSISNAAKRIYEINNQQNDNDSITNKGNNDDAIIDFNDDDNDDDDDDEYLSFIASTIDASNVRLHNGKLAPTIDEKKKVKAKHPTLDKQKEEERKFFDKLEQVTDVLLLQKQIINTQTKHKCIKCNMDFENEFMLMRHVWEYHNQDDSLFI